jgi:N-acetylneuraminate synthase
MKAGYCGKYLFVFDAQSCPAHRHRVKHETFFLVKGSLRVVCDGVERTMGAGDLLPIAPPRVHSFTGQGNALLLELSMPCDVADNDFANPAINRWLRDALDSATQAGSSSRSPSNEAL